MFWSLELSVVFDDLMQMLNRGKKIKASDNETYIAVYGIDISEGLYLAVKEHAPDPSLVYLVKEKKDGTKNVEVKATSQEGANSETA